MSSIPISELAEATIRHLIAALESLTDGELAVDILIACGRRTVPFLSQVLLDGPPQSIAVSRCRVVRALGGLGEKQFCCNIFETGNTRLIQRSRWQKMLFAALQRKNYCAGRLKRYSMF